MRCFSRLLSICVLLVPTIWAQNPAPKKSGDVRFSPDKPFPAGAFVSFYERTSILGLNNYTFTIALPPEPVLRFVRTTIGASAALDSVFETVWVKRSADASRKN